MLKLGIKSPMNLNLMLRGHLRSNDNLHRIAISNLESDEIKLRRWWAKKYRQPPKPLDEYTIEELYIERIEDFYESYPEKAKEFLESVGAKDDDWDGTLPDELEFEIQDRLKKISGKKSVLAKYQTESDFEATDEQINEILAGLGKNLPGSRQGLNSSIITDQNEFEEMF